MSNLFENLSNYPVFHFDNKFWDAPQVYESINLYQIGDLCCNEGYEVEEHVQECYEVSYIVSGRGYFFIDDKPYELTKGDIHLGLPYQIHKATADNIDPFRFFYVGFDFTDWTNEFNDFRHIQKMFDNTKKTVTKDIYGIHEIFIGIFRELLTPKEHSPIMIKTFLNQLIIFTYRSFCGNWQDKYDPSTKLSNDAQITYQVINYIDANITNLQTLSKIGKDLGYSYSYLSQVFSEETGFTIQEYFNQKRFEKATEFLKEDRLTVTEIAEKLNYQSVHSFSKAFKKNIGVSPIQYRDLYMGKIKIEK